ncbi:UvrD-helicase domain-containing protein [Candidatus Solirubrobacter pratensis]|uniref:UvrD-helicase domain-containing protein n=1 Tax=Candidatus Solirubrobacter pratensis TaxID=1298857 RepID=UPI000407E55B|nr:UvrD-helicase domain-containing protein [Candidatus Solirubrobacter pratensis]
MTVALAKRALPRHLMGQMPGELAEAIERLPEAFGQQGLGTNLDIKALQGQPGLYRLRVGGWRAVFLRGAEGFLVGAIGPRRDIYERVARMRLARKGTGLRLLEARAPAEPEDGARARAAGTTRARAPRPVEHNPLSPFSDAELRKIGGVDDELLAFLRALPESVDVAAALGERLEDADLALLLTDLWERPRVHISTFSDGDVPSVEALLMGADELEERLSASDSATELVATSGTSQIQRLLDGSIEEWMVYLHPTQRSIVQAAFNGPARVRGGPGTGKTVVALHRARRLARTAPGEQRILLTTFLRTLPKVWHGLMGLMDATALARLDVVNLDALVARILRDAGERVSYMEDEQRRSLATALVRRHGLESALGGNPTLLLEELDAFVIGRGMRDPEEYFALRRRGGGSPLARPERERVWAAGEDYRRQLARQRKLDYGLARLRALELVREGAGERYAGVVVDEAQDLSEISVRLLHGLDASPGHSGLMIVGDGQQSIYPGGFSLRSLDIDVRGRGRVLTENWRNTWSVWTAARAIVEGEAFDDLDEDVGLRPTGEEPAPLTVGEPAELHVLRSPAEELELLGALVAERVEAGIDAGDIAVLVDVRRKGADAERALKAAGVPTERLDQYEGEHANGVLVGTFRRAKGLEFKEVFVPGLAAAEWPSRWFVPPDLPREQREERLALQRRTLFVGLTRARDRLALLTGGAPAAPVERARWAFDVREY